MLARLSKVSNGNWIEPVVMQGRVARLEPLVPEHAAELLAAADAELFRFTPQAPAEWSVAGFEAEIRHVLSIPGVVPFAVRHIFTGRVAGRTTYMEINPQHRGVEIGRTWLARSHHGTTVNPEIKYLMLRHAFEVLIPVALRVQFTTDESNLHSRKAIEKLGAVREGVLRQHRIVPTGPDPASPKRVRNTVVYSVVADEWARVKVGLEARIGWSENSAS